jgi:hypothetical protein
MISLSDDQLTTIVAAAGTVEPGRRDVFLERVGAMLKLRGRFTDGDVAEVVQLALCGLVQQRQPAA